MTTHQFDQKTKGGGDPAARRFFVDEWNMCISTMCLVTSQKWWYNFKYSANGTTKKAYRGSPVRPRPRSNPSRRRFQLWLFDGGCVSDISSLFRDTRGSLRAPSLLLPTASSFRGSACHSTFWSKDKSDLWIRSRVGVSSMGRSSSHVRPGTMRRGPGRGHRATSSLRRDRRILKLTGGSSFRGTCLIPLNVL